jgi:tRNA nucleotidyltransferase (CCA-adding enzyme)
MGLMTMARRGHAYPSIRVPASELVNLRVVSLPAETQVEDALALATRLDAAALAPGGGARRLVLREDLRRAAALGLGGLVADRLARPIPVVKAGASEISVRRHQAGGAPLVGVREGNILVGAVGTGRLHVREGQSMASRLTATLTPPGLSLLARVGELAEMNGGRAFAVGGVVRDALGSEVSAGVHDLDVVVEGDGLAVARLLASDLGGTLVEHDRFLTASVRDGAGRRVDIATARAEHYRSPGALPQVRPAGIGEDLRRRDFTVNAMAAELSSDAFSLIDPLGGQDDLRRRWLRLLHPLSFVEDPTRIFRAARYQARLDLVADPWTAACRELALEQAPYADLSGPRILAELELILREPRADTAVAALGGVGAFRLLDRRHQFTPTTAARVGELASARAWAQAHGLAAPAAELLLLAVLGDQPPDIAHRALRRLGFEGEPGQRLGRSLEGGARLGQALRTATANSARARLLRQRSALEQTWLWLSGDAGVRSAVTRFLERDGAVESWLNGDEIVGLGIARGPAVGRMLEELRDGRLDRTVANRAAAEDHVRQRAGRTGVNGRGRTSHREEG